MKKIISPVLAIIVFLTICCTHPLLASPACTTNIEEQSSRIIYLNNNCKLNCYLNVRKNTVIQLLNQENNTIAHFEFDQGVPIKTLIYSDNQATTFKGLDFIHPEITSYKFPNERKKPDNEVKLAILKLEEFIVIDKLIVFINAIDQDMELTISYNKDGYLTEEDFMLSSDFSYHIFLKGDKIEKLNYYVKKTESIRHVFYDKDGDGVIDYVTTLELQKDGTHKILSIKQKDEFID